MLNSNGHVFQPSFLTGVLIPGLFLAVGGGRGRGEAGEFSVGELKWLTERERGRRGSEEVRGGRGSAPCFQEVKDVLVRAALRHRHCGLSILWRRGEEEKKKAEICLKTLH